MSDELVMTAEDVMAYLQVNLRTVYRLLHRGLPGFRVGRQWRFRRRDVDAWLDRNRSDKAADTDRPRILVVDDEQAVRDLLVRTLADADWVVDAAPDGPSAMACIQGADYDLLITDLRMPGMDGLSVIREVRRKSLDIPVIVVTGNSTEASAIEAINLGVTGYLTKPFRMQRVLQIAARAMGETLPPSSPDEPGGFQPQ